MTRWMGVVSGAVVLLSATAATGNGGFKAAVAYPAPPAIPVQRAMIVFQDGVQTLAVESSFDTPSPEVGWILPLPAEPTRLEAGDSGMLRTVMNAVQPRITHSLADRFVLARILLAITAVGALGAIIGKGPWAVRLIVYGGLPLLIISLLLPSLGRPRGWAPAGIEVSATQRVGNYDTTVLRATTADALSQWLAAQSLAPLQPSEQAIIEDYIARGWCFIVARLVREGEGVATPHPLIATFPAASPVFPMKMTAIGGSPTRVELLVVADQQASAVGFDCVAADRFDRGRTYDEGDRVTGPVMEAHSLNIEIGHPDAIERMWDGCIITKLTADLSPDQMDHDVEVALSPLQPSRQHFHSPQARRQLVSGVLTVGALPIVALAGVAMRNRRRPTKGVVYAIGVLLILNGVAAVIAWRAVHVIEVREGSIRDVVIARQLPKWQLYSAQDLIDQGLLHAGTTEAELRDLLPRLEKEVDGEGPWTLERSPGNLALRRIDAATWLCGYEPSGREHRLRLPERPATRPTTRP